MEPRRILQGRVPAVVAGASLLTLLGGVGGAVAHGMISSDDIANQSIRSIDIQKGGVGKSELRDASVGWAGELDDHTRQKIRSLAGEDGAVGPRGPAGPPGEPGPQGMPGPAGPAGPAPTYYTNYSGVLTGEALVHCDDGDTAIGGGGTVRDPDVVGGYAPMGASRPVHPGRWLVSATDSDHTVEAFVVCADLTLGRR